MTCYSCNEYRLNMELPTTYHTESSTPPHQIRLILEDVVGSTDGARTRAVLMRRV